jgi:hypothetical protein
MAILTNAWESYSAIGNREDLIDVVTNISPVEAWFTSNTGSVRATNKYHEWTTDALAAAGSNTNYEGNVITASAQTATSRKGNYTQILTKAFAVSDSEEATTAAGGSNHIDYLTAKNMKMLANDIEYALVINSSSASGATGTARQMGGILAFIATNYSTGATGTGTGSLTETMFNDCLQKIWEQGGYPATALTGAFNKRKISAWTTNTREVAADAKKLTAAVDIYQSDFGVIAIRLHQILNTVNKAASNGTIIILGDMDLWKKAWLKPVKKEELARTSLSRLFVISAELTLEARQEKGAGKVYNLTVS